MSPAHPFAPEALRSRMRGPVLGPDDPGYDTARRVHNGMIDKRPALVAYCTGVVDVLAALLFGREHDLPIAVRAGGHNVAGKGVCDAGIVIDVSPMKGIRVDPAARVAHAQAGLTWGQFDRETQVFGLATTGGAISSTGIAGLTLGGGIGWLHRKHGLACDNLLSADVVTAEGRFLTASATENSDLFWGLRGGGGNFGIVTSFSYALHPVGQVLAGSVVHPVSDAEDVFSFYREFSRTAPDEVFAEFALGTWSDGRPAAFIFACYVGLPGSGEDVLRPLRRFGSPVADTISPMDYCRLQQAFDADFPAGLPTYWKSGNLATLNNDIIATMIAHMEKAPSRLPTVIIDPLGGAVARVPNDATAFGHRDAEYDLIIAAKWSSPAEQDAHLEWVRQFWAEMSAHSLADVYVNYLGDEGDARVRAAYGPNYDRLAALKRIYDPDNVFRNNQNIPPS
jgi:FAD/FMN-containing dehydrogenase